LLSNLEKKYNTRKKTTKVIRDDSDEDIADGSSPINEFVDDVESELESLSSEDDEVEVQGEQEEQQEEIVEEEEQEVVEEPISKKEKENQSLFQFQKSKRKRKPLNMKKNQLQMSSKKKLHPSKLLNRNSQKNTLKLTKRIWKLKNQTKNQNFLMKPTKTQVSTFFEMKRKRKL